MVLGLGSGNNSGGNHELFPGLRDVHVVNTILVALVDVALHLFGAVLGSNVDLHLMLEGRIEKIEPTSAAIMLTRSDSLFLVYKTVLLFSIFVVSD